VSLLPWCWLGRVRYQAATELQAALRDRVLAGEQQAQMVLCLEHEPVVTLGRGGGHLLATPAELGARGVEVARASRGGEATYHGPGQLVIYPVVRLGGAVVDFLAQVAGALAEVCAVLGVPGAEWRRAPAGLWLGPAKLAACGLHLRRRVTAHGFALNVSTDPAAWAWIVPCGLHGASIASLAEALGSDARVPAVAEVAALAGPAIARALGHRPLRLEARQPVGPAIAPALIAQVDGAGRHRAEALQ
jgi:lipoate-protein ligase B